MWSNRPPAREIRSAPPRMMPARPVITRFYRALPAMGTCFRMVSAHGSGRLTGALFNHIDIDILAGAGSGPGFSRHRPSVRQSDDERDKDLHLRITYPAENGRYPLIVFSHGASGSKDNYQPLVKHWVSHGYV